MFKMLKGESVFSCRKSTKTNGVSDSYIFMCGFLRNGWEGEGWYE